MAFQNAAADVLLPIADEGNGIRSGIFQPFDMEPSEPNVARLSVRVKGVRYELSCPRDGRPDEMIYDDLLRAARELADRTKGDPT